MKKFSKKLFCLMLVAIMVVAAIPFGAFADGTHAKAEHTAENAKWTYDASRASEITATTHPVVCEACEGEDKEKNAVYHTFGEDGICTGCGYDKFYHVVVTGADLNVTGKTETAISEATTATEAATIAGVSGMNIHDGHTGSGYKATKSYNAATKTLTLKVAEDKHDPIITGQNGDGTKHIVKCKVLGCTYEAEVDHTYDSATGKCACGAEDASFKKDYSIAIKTKGGLQVAESKTVKMTKAEADAVKSNISTTIQTNFPAIYGNLTQNNLKGATAEVDHDKNTILITLDSYGAPETPKKDQIEVIFDNGRTTYITREVGTWYFNTSNLGYDDTWGTEQAKLEIHDANGTRTVAWGSKDDSAYVKATDYKVEVKGINRKVTIYYMKSSTANPTTTDAYATKYYEANTQLGELPALPAGYTAWYVDGVKLTPNTVYSWETKSVYAYPGKGDGNGRVHLFIYNKNNELLKNVDVTESVQKNGLIPRNSLVSTIEYQVGKKNLTLSGLYTESGWAYYLNNKNSTAKAQDSVNVGKDGERQGTQNLYVVLTNVSGGSTADTSNPKTGDTAMIGTAAIVMVLAAAGMGTAFYMKKKELF